MTCTGRIWPNVGSNNYFTDDGWAFWVTGDDTSTIHLNEWLNPAGRSFVDVVVHIRGVLKTTGLHIYIPFSVRREEIDDVSVNIRTQSMMYAIFGVSGLIDYRKNRCTSELAYNGKVIDLVHFSELEYACRPLADGTLLELPFQSLLPMLANDEAYFIFRIPHKSLDRVFHPERDVQAQISRLHSLITSPVVSDHYGYSVRINEVRALPEEINRISAFHRQKLKKASVTISMPEDYEINDSNCYTTRRLEKKLYEGYLPEEFDADHALTYQWRVTREENLQGQFNFYFTIRHEYIKHASLLAYMVILIVTGSAGSALWDLIKAVYGRIFG